MANTLKIFDKVKRNFEPACQEIEKATDRLARNTKINLDDVPHRKYYCNRGTIKNTSTSKLSVEKSWLLIRF